MSKNKSTEVCTFYSKYLLDDLISYKLILENNQLQIKYSTASAEDIDFSRVIDKLKICINKSKSLITDSATFRNNQWYPIFIKPDTNATLSKTLLRGSTSINDTLGIEESVSFPAKFKNWDVSESTNMSIDWVINSSISPYDTQYGLLCWYQESSTPYTNNVEGLPYEEIPLGLIVRPKREMSYKIKIEDDKTITISINENSHLLNIDNNRFEILDIKKQQFKNQFNENDKDIFLYNNSISIFNMSEYIAYEYPKGERESDDDYANRVRGIKSGILLIINGISPNNNAENLFENNNKKQILYISNGDVYSFYNDKSEKTTLLAEGFPSSTYLSSTLFPIYREIWHSLTINNKRLDSTFLSRKQHKLLQKVCQYLSTFPLIDRTTVNILTDQDIQNTVKEFINKSFNSIELEIKELFNVLNIIGKKFIDLSVDIKSNDSDHTCFIRDKKHLFNKLLAKYGSYLNIKQNTIIKYKPPLPYGPHLKFAQDITSKVSKEASNKIVFNNFTANIGSFSLSTNMTANRTYFSINNTDVPGQSTNIPLWDIQKKELSSANLNISAGPDLIIPLKFPVIDGDSPKIIPEMTYELDAAELGDIDSEILKGEKLQILWSRIYGPDCLRFSDANLSTIRSEGGIGGPNAPTLATPDFSSTNITKHGVTGAGNATPPQLGFYDSRYEESTDPVPILYIKKTGKYILRLKVKASFGVVYDTVTIYVVNNNGEYEPGKRPPPLKAATFVTLQPSNGLTIFCPNIRQFAVGKQGIFWPINSDLSTYDTESNPYGTVASFGGQIRKYSIPMPFDADNKKIVTNDPVSLVLKYDPNNTTINLRKIVLSHMRDTNPNCENCETFYTNTLDNKGFVVDINRDFTLTDVATKDPVTNKATQLTFSYPSEVSTKYSKVKTYGGYSVGQIDKLGVSVPYSLSPGNTLPSITGANMDNMKYSDGTISNLCFMKSVEGEKPISFEKGCFYPQSGWMFGTSRIDNINYVDYRNSNPATEALKNKTAVINFDPGNRKTFRFKGPGFFNLNNSSNDSNPNKQVYFSTIGLSIDTVAQDCYNPGEEFSDLLQCTEQEFIENEAQEKSDLDPNHGYRSVGGDFAKLQIITSDETIPSITIDPDGATTSNNYCNTPSAQRYSADYTFTRRGSYLPLGIRKPKLRFNKSITGAKIEDIEVQVNFINYVNTKNLMIWLDVVPCAAVVRKLYDHYGATSNSTETMSTLTKGADRWYYSQKLAPDSVFPNKYKAAKAALEALEDGPLKKYLLALFAMNNNPKPEDTATGEAAPTSVTNTLSSGAGTRNSATASMEGGTTEITADGEGVPWSPTFRLYLLNQEHIEGNRYNFSLRFSDKAGRYASPHDKNYTKYTDPQQVKAVEKDGIIHLLPTVSAFGYDDKDVAFFQNIIRTNSLNTLNNTFAKFAGMDLFQGANGKLGFGSTTFTLGVAVMNESDSMEVLDNINNIDQINGIEQTIKNNRSNFLINNICSWELILHSSQNSFEPVDALGNIKYAEPNISGYNFIANFEDKKYLIPPVNLNAPYEYMQDGGLCKYNKERLNVPVYSYTPLNILPIINVGGAISIVDALGQIV